MAIDFSDLGGQRIPDSAPIDFSDLGGQRIETKPVSNTDIYKGVAKTLYNKLPWVQVQQGLKDAGGAIAEEGGKLGYPKTGVALGGALVMAPDIAGSIFEPGAGIALPGAGAAEEIAQSAGRRALGFTKPLLKTMIKKTGSIDGANKTAQIMLDNGVIANPLTHPLSSSASDMLTRAQDLGDQAGEKIGGLISNLSSRGIPSIDTNEVGNEVLNQLASPRTGGAYDQQNAIATEIANTIGAHGNGPIDFNSAQALKQKLGELASFNKNSDALKSNMYQRAYGIVNKALGDSIESATKSNPLEFANYLANKSTYGASESAQNALLNRVSSDAGNRKIGLTDMIAAGAEMGAGHPVAAAGIVGLKKAAEEYGLSGMAVLANKLAQARIPEATRNAILEGYRLHAASQPAASNQ